MKQILLAGFGGQGILFMGKFLTYMGMMSDQEVSWLPSYGPEMRGGTANCSVVIAEKRIGSPVVSSPNLLVCMNRPSLDKFEENITVDGLLFCDNSLVDRETTRGDISAFNIPATRIASDNGIPKLANIIMLGFVIRHSGICDMDMAAAVMKKIVPTGKQELLDANLKALDVGYNYEA